MNERISSHSLLSIINTELSKLEECPGCRISDVILLDKLDSSGCNWDGSEMRCGDHADLNCKHIVNHVIAWAKSSYKLTYS